MPQLGTRCALLTLRAQVSAPGPFHTITTALRFQVRQCTQSSLVSRGLGLREHPTHSLLLEQRHLSSAAAPLA